MDIRKSSVWIVHTLTDSVLIGISVKGDGSTDDSASLNAILADNAANGKVSYFPYGVYIVKRTLVVPPGSRIVGEAWPAISGKSWYRILWKAILFRMQVLAATLVTRIIPNR